MGGKKKSLANRLAKMSDEERARYLQHKADQEEEAKKRKEQLISMFMKNKIKKEDGFSRLNLAKINQQWHQILRLNKCKEMKEDVEHIKTYMARILDYKNRTIKKLQEELEMAEEQYKHNFQVHAVHIDQTIDSHEKYMSSMEEQFYKDLDELLEISNKEHEDLTEKTINQHQHLQTIIFGQESKFKEGAAQDKERLLKKKEELTSTYRLKLDSYIKSRENQCGALWRQIAGIVKSHVAQTDTRRLHLAELKRLDAESAAEINKNQERITMQEEEITTLNHQYENLVIKRNDNVVNLKKQIQENTTQLCSVRKNFRKAVEKDEKWIVILTHESNQAIEYLTKLKNKGQQIITLMMTCKKFETEKEQLTRFLPMEPSPDIIIDSEEFEDMKKKLKPYEDDGDEMVKKVVITMKESPPSTGKSEEENIINREFALLDYMENFWMIYNKANLDFKELKQEKKILFEQNKHFRGMIRAVLEAAALDRTTPNSKVSTRVASKRGVSAPLKRILI